MPYIALLAQMGFTLQNNKAGVFFKEYIAFARYGVVVDINKQQVNFGKLITSESKSTQSLNTPETWVVLECVNRLLEKGYPPQNIRLEKTYPSGHGTSGRLDILVTKPKDPDKKASKNLEEAYLMIECKTFGTEYNKAHKRLLQDGGQLFTYFQQDKAASILMLYASHLAENGQIAYVNSIIKIEDDHRKTSNVKDFYDRWNKLPKDNGIFETEVNAYDFKSKALLKRDLKEITHSGSSFIFNQFLEILRHNTVSDKPNAFNKIFTLFLCKIYDESAKKEHEELDFQWIEPESHINFQKRLNDLYKKGMLVLLGKTVIDLSEQEFRNRYSTYVSASKIEDMLKDFTDTRLKKNNEFAIKEVFDDDSFEENAKVVKEVVELLQGYKIRYTERQQYLSDFFELLLTTGLKQESGQFFTPVPVAQFIIKSLPLDTIIAEKLEKGIEKDLLPSIIDYAAGSGHFLTESMHDVQRILNQINPADYLVKTSVKIKNWQNDHFDWAEDYVYGIEKDYRLVKVGKVGCYLHGDGVAQVIHGDGLESFEKSKVYKDKLIKRKKTITKEDPQDNGQFDVVISNPPYSVSAFKGTLEHGEESFDLFAELTDQSSQIECLFVERTKQLLKEGGYAGIILPSSILSNTGIYTKAREIILKYFDIVAIAQLGSNTFMATGTNTITLFLKRRENQICEDVAYSIKKFATDLKDVTINGVGGLVSKYVAQVWQGLAFDDYITLFAQKPNAAVLAHELFQDYQKKITSKTPAEKGECILAIECEKLFYFALAYKQQVVLINSGEKNAEKAFLGYEFSNRRGHEGLHPVQRGKMVEDCTQLFDPNIFDNPEKASTYVYDAFQGLHNREIADSLKKNISRHRLVDFFTFDRAGFEKNLNLNNSKKIRYEDIWGTADLKLLGDLSEIRKGTAITKYQAIEGDIPVIAGGKGIAYFHNQANRAGNVITVSASGAAGFVSYHENPIFASDCNTIISKDEQLISTKLIFLFMQLLQVQIYALGRGQIQAHVYGNDLAQIKIPLPPINIQQQIVTEIEVLEQKEEQAKERVEELKGEIEGLISKRITGSRYVKIGEVATSQYGFTEKATDAGEIRYLRITDLNEDGTIKKESPKFINPTEATKDQFLLKNNDIVIARSGSVGKSALYKSEYEAMIFASYLIRLKADETKILPKYLFNFTKTSLYWEQVKENSIAVAQPNLNAEKIKLFKIPLPSLPIQQQLVTQIEVLEKEINQLQEHLAELPAQKEAVLKKYL